MLSPDQTKEITGALAGLLDLLRTSEKLGPDYREAVEKTILEDLGEDWLQRLRNAN